MPENVYTLFRISEGDAFEISDFHGVFLTLQGAIDFAESEEFRPVHSPAWYPNFRDFVWNCDAYNRWEARLTELQP